MRALILHGPDDLRLDEVPEPVPAPGEIVLAVETALTCATDAKMLRRGVHPALPPPPTPFGHEASGRVAACGRGVTSVRPGDAVVVANSAPCGTCRACRRGRAGLCADLVYLTGAYAEYLRVPARIVDVNVVARPAGLDPALAALTEPVACAVRGVERSAAAPGDVAVVLGGGLQGVVCAALLTLRGCEVTLCDPHALRRERALLFGVERVHDAPRDAEGIARVRAALGGCGADVVVCAVGDVTAWEVAVSLAAPGGEVNLHGGPAGDAVMSVPAAGLHYGEITLQASYHHTPTSIRTALGLIAASDLPFDTLLGSAIPLECVPDVLRSGGEKRPVHPAMG